MNRLGILLLLGAVLGSCNERDFRRSEWFDGGPDTILDGAMRISTWTSRDERYLTIRCFRFKADSEPKYDLRYEINMPLLERVAKDLEKSTTLDAAVAADGTALGMYKARAGFQRGQLWFLIDVDESVIAVLAAAKKDINVVPREDSAKLDKIIAFSTAGLADRIKPVMKACEKKPSAGDAAVATGAGQ